MHIRTLVAVLLLVSASAHAAKKIPELNNVASTDDCFQSYGDNGQHCELSYCLNTVMGEKDQVRNDDFQGCASRTLASMPTPEETGRK